MITIRPANRTDAAGISALIFDVKHFFTLQKNGDGAEEFLASISAAAIAGYILDKRYDYFVAMVDLQLAGVVAIRDNRHLFHLFVPEPFQHHKIAGQLWRFAKANAIEWGNDGSFTVNSSLNAVAMYEHFGFRTAGPRTETHGIAFIPMTLHCDPSIARDLHTLPNASLDQPANLHSR